MGVFSRGVLLAGLLCASVVGDEWKAGMAAVCITPDEPVHLLGYQNRDRPFESVETDIYAKALAIEDAEGNRGVIVTSDLVGFQDAYSRAICDRITEKTGLQRGQLILNASHNHTGPLVSLDPIRQGNIAHGNMTEADAEATIRYSRQLQDKIVKLVEDAMADLRPAELSSGSGAVGFVMNRRVGTSGAISMGPNPQGVVDRVVPVLKVASPDGSLRCVLFGCACHNTTLTPDHNVISGDYAGYAQDELQRKFPGAQAMFMSGCGADANPEPRGTFEQARQHGEELAKAVSSVVEGKTTPVEGSLRTAYKVVELPLQNIDRETLAKYLPRGDGQAMMAAHMIRLLEGGNELLDSYPAPVAVWQIGDDVTLVALPGEGVADYADLVRRKLKSREVWVSSYNNDCFGYLPTAQIVEEGGHEAIGVTVWVWGNSLAKQAGFFSGDVERTILDTVGELADEANHGVAVRVEK